jgi:hypothetical protein
LGNLEETPKVSRFFTDAGGDASRQRLKRRHANSELVPFPGVLPDTDHASIE